MRKWIDLCEGQSPASILREELITLGSQMGLEVDVALHHDYLIELSLLVTPPEVRRQGRASAFMAEMVQRADATGVSIEIYAEPIDNALPWDDLITFYKRFGFTETPGDGKGYLERAPK